MENSKISVITTSYSIRNLNEIIENVKQQTYKNIEIIMVDDRNVINEQRDYFFSENIFVNIFKPEQRLGYYKSLKFGFMQATGDYILFNTKDCILEDINFFKKAIKKFKSYKDIDIVFGKTCIESPYKFQVKQHKFKEFYFPNEFIEEWEKLRMIFVDYFDLNSFIFKKRILFNAKAFSSNYENALSLDTSTLLKSVIVSKKIAYIDLFACKRFINNLTNKDYNTTDLTTQIIHHFAISFDVKDFIKNKNINIPNLQRFLNKYADYAINSIYFDYFSNFNEEIFNKILSKNNLRGKKIFIYGKGWIGLAFEKFLNDNGIKIENFIDDFRSGEKIISFEKFKNLNHDKSIAIIATYKYKDAFNLFKKLSQIKELEIIDLFIKDIC